MGAVKIGIIGIGNMGGDHAKRLMAGNVGDIELIAVADTNPERLKDIGEKYPALKLFPTGEAMMDSGCVEAALIATPHYSHPGLAIAALNRGLHVLCEKPAGVYTKAVREVNELAEKSNAVYAMMYNCRTNSVYKKLKEIVDSGEMGRMRRVSWLATIWYRSQSYYDSGAWRATWAGEGGGVLLNQCPHNLDLWQWICGMPKKVRAFTHDGKWHDIEVEDDVTAYVEYENGATGVFVTTTGDTPGTNRLEIVFDSGKLVCEDDRLFKYKLEMSEPEFSATYKGGFGEPKYEKTEVETDGSYPQHDGVLAAFAAKIRGQGELIASGAEGIRGLELSNAMHLSSWLDRTVELPIDEDLFLSELNKRRAASRHKDVTGVVLSTEGTYGR